MGGHGGTGWCETMSGSRVGGGCVDTNRRRSSSTSSCPWWSVVVVVVCRWRQGDDHRWCRRLVWILTGSHLGCWRMIRLWRLNASMALTLDRVTFGRWAAVDINIQSLLSIQWKIAPPFLCSVVVMSLKEGRRPQNRRETEEGTGQNAKSLGLQTPSRERVPTADNSKGGPWQADSENSTTHTHTNNHFEKRGSPLLLPFVKFL